MLFARCISSRRLPQQFLCVMLILLETPHKPTSMCLLCEDIVLVFLIALHSQRDTGAVTGFTRTRSALVSRVTAILLIAALWIQAKIQKHEEKAKELTKRLDPGVDCLLNLPQSWHILARDDRQRMALCISASSASRTMDVRVDFLLQTSMNHQRHIRNINTTSCAKFQS
jgi:hypothetical protein